MANKQQMCFDAFLLEAAVLSSLEVYGAGNLLVMLLQKMMMKDGSSLRRIAFNCCLLDYYDASPSSSM